MHQQEVIEMFIMSTVDWKLSQSINEEVFCGFLLCGSWGASSSYGLVWLHTAKVVPPSSSGILKFKLAKQIKDEIMQGES